MIPQNRQNRENALNSVMFGKVPPQALDLEQAVLGAILIDKDAMPEVYPILQPESFYDDRHRLVYSAMLQLHDKDLGIDLLTVIEELRKMSELENAGGPFYITSLTNHVTGAAHVEEHARIVEQKSIQRKLINLGSILVKNAYEDSEDVFELLEKIETDLSEINGSLVSNEIYHISEIGNQVRKENAEKLLRKVSPGVHTGYKDIDTDIGEMQNGDLIIWAGRASMGKTAMMICAAYNQASTGMVVGILSMEMTRQQIYNRFICLLTGIPTKKLNRDVLTDEERVKKEDAERHLNSLPLYIEDSANPTVGQFKTRCMRMKRKYKVEIIYGDHLGKLTLPKETNDYIITSTAVKTCKAIAKTLNIPLVILAQLSRKTELERDMKPRLSHLRDSGKIEEEADVVALFYRPEYYDRQGIKGFETVMHQGRKIPSKGYTEANFVKNRNGEVKPINLTFIGESMKFIKFDESYFTREADRERLIKEQTLKNANRQGLFTKVPGGIDSELPPPPPSDDDDVPF